MDKAAKRPNQSITADQIPQSKRSKNEQDVSESTFAAQLAKMPDLCEEDMDTDTIAGSQESRWRRKPVSLIKPTEDVLIFQQMDLDHYLGQHIAGMPGATEGKVPIIRMFGVTDEGNSVLAHIHGFLPYFHVPAPEANFTDENCVTFRDQLNAAIVADSRGNQGVAQPVLGVEVEQKSSMYGFRFNRLFPFLKITLAVPKLLAPAKRLLEQGITVAPFGFRGFQVYESNIDFEIRFMVDSDVVGCNWIECPPGKYHLRKPSYDGDLLSSSAKPISSCQIEFDISWEEIISHAPEGEWQKIAPLRILSFDIECSGRKGIFPEPDKDAVIQIANMVTVQGEKDPFIRNIFTLDTCAPVVGSHVITNKTEKDLLMVSLITEVHTYVCIQIYLYLECGIAIHIYWWTVIWQIFSC